MENLNLTELENQTLTELFKYIDINEYQNFSNAGVEDLSQFTGIEIKKMRGVLASLIKKGIVSIEDFDGDGTELVYLNDEYMHLTKKVI